MASGLNLVGIKDTHVATEKNIEEIFEKKRGEEIIVIPATLYQKVKEKVKKLPQTTMVVELPDDDTENPDTNNGLGEDKAMEWVKNAIGRSIQTQTR